MMIKSHTKFYYTVLNEDKKKIYISLYTGFKERKKDIWVEANTTIISMKEISDIAVFVYNDNPLFYYVDIKKFQIEKRLFGYYFHCEYLMCDREISKANIFLEKGIVAFEKMYLNSSMSEYDIEKQLHNYLINAAIYDNDAVLNEHLKGEAFNVLGPLLNKKGVCWGFSCAFKFLCDSFGIKCLVIMGQAKSNDGNEDHAWNIVKIGNCSYHVDVTWDLNDNIQVKNNYKYFNLDDKAMRIDHKWDEALYPKCNSFALS